MNNNEPQSSRELLINYQTSKLNDVFDSGVKAVISQIPGVSQFYNDFVKSPSQKRLNKFLEALVADLERLQEQMREQVNLDSPSFQTTLMNALQIVIKNHQQEKIDALRNMVLNSTLPNAPIDDIQLMFLNLIDEFTTWHLTLLNYCNDLDVLDQYPDKSSLFPDLEKNTEFYNLVLTELVNKKLIFVKEVYINYEEENQTNFSLSINPINFGIRNTIPGVPRFKIDKKKKTMKDVEDIDDLFINKSPHWKMGERTTNLGKQFLSFIKSPLTTV